MAWLELTLLTDREHAPLIEAALELGGALAVTVLDAADDPDRDPILEPAPAQTPIWRQIRIKALFTQDAKGAQLAQAAAAALAEHCQAPPRVDPLEDRPWEREWMQGLAPMRFGQRLWICPRGQRPELDPERPELAPICLDLDPGLAFGTGHHPTTALCLRWLDGLDVSLIDRLSDPLSASQPEPALVATHALALSAEAAEATRSTGAVDRIAPVSLAGCRVLDFGCGSGILAIAALLLGADEAIGVDHDPQALEASRENARENGVGDRLQLLLPDQFGGHMDPHWDANWDDQDPQADLVLANILAGPLISLAPRLAALSKPGALIGLSGILRDQAESVMAAYRPFFQLQGPVFEGDWVLLTGRRRHD